jgi:hypothetical protein
MTNPTIILADSLENTKDGGDVSYYQLPVQTKQNHIKDTQKHMTVSSKESSILHPSMVEMVVERTADKRFSYPYVARKMTNEDESLITNRRETMEPASTSSNSHLHQGYDRNSQQEQ